LIGRAIALDPESASTHYNLGVAQAQLGRHKEALASFDAAVALKPDYAEALNNRGNVLSDLTRPDDALASYDRALVSKPEYAEAHSNRGNLLASLGRIEEALAGFERAIALKPDYADAHWSLSLSLLQAGRWQRGWREYEWRKRKREPIAARDLPRPLWLGQDDLDGKRLFLYWEQGFGDTIQFCRYAKLAEAAGARVILSVQPPLRRLLAQLSPTIEFIRTDRIPDSFDYHAPLMSLQLAFATTAETIPAAIPYLAAEPERVEHWRRRLGEGGVRVGISWQGSTGKMDRGRSVRLSELYPLARIPGIRLISLQKNVGTEQLEDVPDGVSIETLGDEFDAGPHGFLDTAAVMESLDLVITCDTAIAHLAGALGRPAWVALKKVPDWRWLLQGSDSPWYPTLRLFRQREPGEWKPVFEASWGPSCPNWRSNSGSAAGERQALSQPALSRRNLDCPAVGEPRQYTRSNLMPTWAALTTLDGQPAAEALAEAMEALAPAPTGVDVMEIEDGSGHYEVGGCFIECPDEAGLALLAAIHSARPFAVSRVDDRDWITQVQRELTPVETGRFILYGGHDAAHIPPNRLGLRIEAAMAFGTGHHGTTRGCLLLLERLVRRGEKPRRVADLGCGTGVLAMAAAKAWRVPCDATDIDPVAAWTAAENARANHLHPWIRSGQAAGVRSDLLRARAPYDLIFANILAAPLKRLAPDMARYLAPGGAVILSGLLRSQVAGVEAVYAGHGLHAAHRMVLGEWVSLLLRDRRPAKRKADPMRSGRP